VTAPILPPPRLRLAAAADVPALAGLYADTARAMGPRVYTREQVAAWASFGVAGAAFAQYVLGAQTWIAEGDDQTALGFCGIDAVGEVRSLYVRAELTRRGLGGALLAHALAQARQHGLATFATWATPFSVPVFERAGFRLVERVRAPYQGVEFERYRMVLD
jgi:putative acetyltransferase